MENIEKLPQQEEEIQELDIEDLEEITDEGAEEIMELDPEDLEEITEGEAEEIEGLDIGELEEITEKEARRLERAKKEEPPSLEDLVAKNIEVMRRRPREIEDNARQRIDRVAETLDVSQEMVEEEKAKMAFEKRGGYVLNKVEGLVNETEGKFEKALGKKIERKEKIDIDIERFEGKSFRAEGGSIESLEHPDRNEDAMLMAGKEGVFGVFDGMGGLEKGDVASQTAKKQVENNLDKLSDKLSVEEIKKNMKEILIKADKGVKETGGGTTASLVKVLEKAGKRKAIIGNVGDSRVYIREKNGSLKQVTIDDDPFSAALKQGYLSEEKVERLQYGLDNYEKMSQFDNDIEYLVKLRNQTVGLGKRGDVEPEFRVYEVDLKKGEELLITSDGIHDNCTKKQMEEGLKGGDIAELFKKAKDISALGKEKTFRSKPDDITGVLLNFDKK